MLFFFLDPDGLIISYDGEDLPVVLPLSSFHDPNARPSLIRPATSSSLIRAKEVQDWKSVSASQLNYAEFIQITFSSFWIRELDAALVVLVNSVADSLSVVFLFASQFSLFSHCVLSFHLR